MFQSAFSRVLLVASCALWCVGGMEAQSTYFPVDDSCPGHGTDCKRGLGEPQNTQTHMQTTRPFARDVVGSVLEIQEFAQICMHKAIMLSLNASLHQTGMCPLLTCLVHITQTHLGLVFHRISVQREWH